MDRRVGQATCKSIRADGGYFLERRRDAECLTQIRVSRKRSYPTIYHAGCPDENVPRRRPAARSHAGLPADARHGINGDGRLQSV